MIFGVLFSFMTLIYAKSHWLFLTHWKSSLDLHISQTFQPKRSRRKGRVWKRGVAVLDVKFTVKNLPFLHCKTARKFIFIEVMSTHAYCVWASIKVIFFLLRKKKSGRNIIRWSRVGVQTKPTLCIYNVNSIKHAKYDICQA